MPDEYSISQLDEALETTSDDLVEVVIDTDTVPKSRKMKRSTLLAGTAAQADLDAHVTDTNNPHTVTTEQIGAASVESLASHTGSAAIHRQISDGSTSSTSLWSASKISSELAGKGSAAEVAANTEARHTHGNKDVLDDTTAAFTTEAQSKLKGIDEGATANAADADLRDRSTHTGTQTASTISNFNTAADARITAQKGQSSGLATLDGSGKVPSTQLPSFVDDVLEFDSSSDFPATGETGKIYVALDANKVYRWGGSAYTEISPSPGSTDAVPEGSSNLYFTNERASSASPVQSVAGRSGEVELGKEDVGLENVPNVDATNRSNHSGTQSADTITDGTTNKAYTAAEQTKLSGIETGADVTDAGNVGGAIHGAAGKSTPVDADTVSLIDSAASNVLKKLSWANIKATLKSFFDTLYGKPAATVTVGPAGSVADFICDGTADNVEIQAAINAIASTGGVVLLREGTYNLNSRLTFAGNNVTLKGSGIGKTTLQFQSGTTETYLIVDSADRSNIDISGITFFANGKTNAGLAVLQGVLSNIRVHHCEFKGVQCPSGARWPLKLGTVKLINGTVSAVDTDTDTLTVDADFATGTPVIFSTTDTLPTGLSTSASYYAIRVSATEIKVATSIANAKSGTAVDISGSGSGTLTLQGSDYAGSQSRNVRVEHNRFVNNDPYTFEILLAVNMRDSWVQNNYFAGNTLANSDEVSFYPHHENTVYAHNIHFNSNAAGFGAKDAISVSVHDNLFWYTDHSNEAINMRDTLNCSVHHNLFYQDQANTSRAVGIEDTAGPNPYDGWAPCVQATRNLTVRDNRIYGFNYGIEAALSATSRDLDIKYVTIEANDIDGATVPIRFGTNSATIDLKHWWIRGNRITNWIGSLLGAIHVIGYSSGVDQVSDIYIHDNYVQSRASGTNGGVRAVGATITEVRGNTLATSGSYGAISTANGGVISQQFNNLGATTNQLAGLDMQSNKITNVANPTAAQDSATKSYVDSTVATAAPDATTSAKGKVQLAGDLGGTATSPTTPTAVHITGTETIGGAKTFTTSPTISNSAPALNLVETDQTAPAGVYRVDVSDDTMRFVRSSTVLATVNTNTFALMRSLTLPLATKTANYTLTAADSIILADATSGTITMNLPTAVGIAGRQYTIKKIDSSGNAVVVDPNGSQTVDGATTLSLVSQYQSVTVVSDGGNWVVV